MVSFYRKVTVCLFHHDCFCHVFLFFLGGSGRAGGITNADFWPDISQTTFSTCTHTHVAVLILTPVEFYLYSYSCCCTHSNTNGVLLLLVLILMLL